MRKHLLLFSILALGIALRIYHPLILFGYSHDQDLASWIIKDIVQNHHLRLIGQETSVHGVYIGALWYYLLIPFYFVFNWSPVGGILLSLFLAVSTISGIYFVGRKIFSPRIASFASTIYASSFYIIMTDREVVPTTTVMLWTIFYIYSLHLLLTKNIKWGLILSALLFTLTWHINLALLLLLPITFITLLFTRKNLTVKNIIPGFVVGLFALVPFVLFELKTKFLQTQTILLSLKGGGNHSDFLAKLDHTTALVSRNIDSLLFVKYFNLPQRFPLYIIITIFLFLSFKKKIKPVWQWIFGSWLILYILFFTFNSINLSEYYLNGLMIPFIFVLAILFDFLFSHKKLRPVAVILLSVYIVVNVSSFLNQPINKSSFIQRNAVVDEIANDAELHNYPCVSVSYITSPGYNLGYRYLFYLKKLHVNDPISKSPVYTIVFPLSSVDGFDKSFGALGLIYPDYKKYSPEAVQESCSGQDSNLTNPLFGYTQ